MSGNPCLILEWSDSAAWGALQATVRRIPAGGQPTVLQPDRETAEREAQSLAARFPDKRFAVFEATVEARCVDVPSHVTVSGKVWLTRRMPVLVDIDDSEVPF